jgi:hypothetical protein
LTLTGPALHWVHGHPDRRWHRGSGRILALGRPGWREARQIHADRFPHVPAEDADLFVAVTINDPTYPAG